MPSLRHALMSLYIQKFLRRHPDSGDDLLLAADIAARRTREHPEPPRRLRRRVRSTVHDGFSIHTYTPLQVRSDARIIWLHGGAYVHDLSPSHWRFIARLGDQLGVAVVVPQYPLAPESTWTQSRAALLELVSSQRGRTVLVGDSAGGGLALALALAQQATSQKVRLAGLVLVAPWVDLTVDPAYGVVDDDPWLTPSLLRSAARLWAGGDGLLDPGLSPLHGVMEGLPPTLIFSGTRDILHPANLALTTRLDESSVNVRCVTGEGLIHVYPLLPIPEARYAFAQIIAFINDAIR